MVLVFLLLQLNQKPSIGWLLDKGKGRGEAHSPFSLMCTFEYALVLADLVNIWRVFCHLDFYEISAQLQIGIQ